MGASRYKEGERALLVAASEAQLIVSTSEHATAVACRSETQHIVRSYFDGITEVGSGDHSVACTLINTVISLS